MSEIEELRQRVKELVAENESLRGHKKRTKHRLPGFIQVKYRYQAFSTPRPEWGDDGFRNWPDDADLQTLSTLVRRLCIAMVRVKTKSGYERTGAIQLEDMNDEQYDKYLRLMDQIMGVLFENRIPDDPQEWGRKKNEHNN